MLHIHEIISAVLYLIVTHIYILVIRQEKLMYVQKSHFEFDYGGINAFTEKWKIRIEWSLVMVAKEI